MSDLRLRAPAGPELKGATTDETKVKPAERLFRAGRQARHVRSSAEGKNLPPFLIAPSLFPVAVSSIAHSHLVLQKGDSCSMKRLHVGLAVQAGEESKEAAAAEQD